MGRGKPLRIAAATAGAVAVGALGYLGLVSGKLTADLGFGRRTRPLGPQTIDIAAPRDVVFDVIAQPYLGRRTRAMADKITLLHAGTDLVLAAHHTPLYRHLVATTVETVKFARPDRVEFRLVRGPVPHVAETFTLTDHHTASGDGTRLTYTGELGTDLWALGQGWGRIVAQRWENVVAASLTAIKSEAEHRTAHPR